MGQSAGWLLASEVTNGTWYLCHHLFEPHQFHYYLETCICFVWNSWCAEQVVNKAERKWSNPSLNKMQKMLVWITESVKTIIGSVSRWRRARLLGGCCGFLVAPQCGQIGRTVFRLNLAQAPYAWGRSRRWSSWSLDGPLHYKYGNATRDFRRESCVPCCLSLRGGTRGPNISYTLGPCSHCLVNRTTSHVCMHLSSSQITSLVVVWMLMLSNKQLYPLSLCRINCYDSTSQYLTVTAWPSKQQAWSKLMCKVCM